LRLKRREVLEALSELDVPIATTNYDGLIEEVTGLEPVTWRDRNRVQRVIRGDEAGGLHLHGFWGDPQSVVLGVRSYDDVVSDPHAQATLRALAIVKSFLLVGFGAGLTDPNFGALREWMREALPGAEYRHFRLAREGEVAATVAQHDAGGAGDGAGLRRPAR